MLEHHLDLVAAPADRTFATVATGAGKSRMLCSTIQLSKGKPTGEKLT